MPEKIIQPDWEGLAQDVRARISELEKYGDEEVCPMYLDSLRVYLRAYNNHERINVKSILEEKYDCNSCKRDYDTTIGCIKRWIR